MLWAEIKTWMSVLLCSRGRLIQNSEKDNPLLGLCWKINFFVTSLNLCLFYINRCTHSLLHIMICDFFFFQWDCSRQECPDYGWLWIPTGMFNKTSLKSCDCLCRNYADTTLFLQWKRDSAPPTRSFAKYGSGVFSIVNCRKLNKSHQFRWFFSCLIILPGDRNSTF